MAVKFQEKNHKYESTDGANIKWVSATSLISQFKEPFDADASAKKSSKNKNSKWYGLPPEEIKAVWENISKQAQNLGTWYHNEREKLLCELDTIEREGQALPVIRPVFEGGEKLAPEQKLQNGIYPEHFVYLKSVGVCGQSDLVEIVNNTVHITDYKTNNELKVSGYKNWDGVSKKLLSPINHLDDCHMNHYALQLSIYMYIIIKHNPNLRPGKLTIHHIIFEELGKDKYGYGIKALDGEGNPIVKEIIPYDLPYLRSEVVAIFNWLKENQDNLKPKK